MTLKKVLYCTRVHITGSWKKAFMMRPLSLFQSPGAFRWLRAGRFIRSVAWVCVEL